MLEESITCAEEPYKAKLQMAKELDDELKVLVEKFGNTFDMQGKESDFDWWVGIDANNRTACVGKSRDEVFSKLEKRSPGAQKMATRLFPKKKHVTVQAHFLLPNAEDKLRVLEKFAIDETKPGVRIIDTFYRQGNSNVWLRARQKGLKAIRKNEEPTWSLIQAHELQFPPLPVIGRLVYDRFSNADGTAKFDKFVFRDIQVFTVTMTTSNVISTIQELFGLGLKLCKTKIQIHLEKEEEALKRFGAEVDQWRRDHDATWETMERILEDVKDEKLWLQTLAGIPEEESKW
jgi:hypothetical protein